MADRPLRVALLGAGGRGCAVLANWIEQTHCQVTAIVDPSEKSLERARQRLGDKVAGAEFVQDVQGWYGRADCDVVTVNSWDPQHAENAIACFEAGLNVQVAKPMTQSIADADRVYHAWKKSGKIGVVDMQIRWTELICKARAIIDSGALGKVHLINCFDMVGRSGVEFRSQRSRRRDMIRSWTLAKGVHFLDLLNCLMDDDPVRVYASGGRNVFGGDKPNDLTCSVCEERDTCEFEGSKITIGGIPYGKAHAGCVFSQEMDLNDNCAAVVEYARGGRATYAECYFTPEYQTTYDVIGERGALFIRYAMDNRLYLEFRRRGGATVEHINIFGEGAHGGGDVAIIRQLAQALRENRQIRPDIRDGRQSVALCESLDLSMETHQVVTIPPIPEAAPSSAAAATVAVAPGAGALPGAGRG